MCKNTCWICKSSNIKKVKEGIEKEISPNDFNITDDRYGTTLGIYRCLDCKFEFCPVTIDLTNMKIWKMIVILKHQNLGQFKQIK